MADRLTPGDRSALMARVRSKDTKPELAVRRLLHRQGYRFRTHYKLLPGRPDIAFTRKRKAVLVHGCFWHGHDGCPGFRTPSSRTEFWEGKFERNRARDRRNEAQARALGWQMLVVWECEIRDEEWLAVRLADFLGPPRTAGLINKAPS